MERRGKIVSLAAVRRRAEFSRLDEIEGYWERLRRKRLMPARSEIDPRAISGMLENTFILERTVTGLARIRLAGQRMNDLVGSDARGIPFSRMFEPAARPGLTDALEAVFSWPAVVRISLMSDPPIGGDILVGNMILLPLRSDLGDVSRALGCLVYDGRNGRSPRRFAIADESRRSLVGYAGAEPDEAEKIPVAGAPAPSQGAEVIRLRERVADKKKRR